MAYRLKRKESIAKGVRRVARRELSRAVEQLRGRCARGLEEPIHEARKRIKKVRALLRLAQDDLGGSYRSASRRLREAGRNLSPVRDAGALITAFDRLTTRKKIRKRDSEAMRRALVQHKTQVEEELGVGELAGRTARLLEQVRKSAKRWKVQRDGFRAIEAGVKKAFRRGRKALCTAVDSGRREDLHEWRKRVKDHWYHARLLGAGTSYERRLKELEDALGEFLNLAMLREHAIGAPPALIAAIDEEEGELRKRALEIGGKVYRMGPAEVAKMLRKSWK
jgi:CHAD domain-containing protein